MSLKQSLKIDRKFCLCRCYLVFFESRHEFESNVNSVACKAVYTITPCRKGFGEDCELCLIVDAPGGVLESDNGVYYCDGVPLSVKVFALAGDGNVLLNEDVAGSVYQGVAGGLFMPIARGRREVLFILKRAFEISVITTPALHSRLVYVCY